MLALFQGFHKINGLMDQLELIQPEQLPARLRWEKLFHFLPPWPPECPRKQGRGRKPVDRNSMLKALILQRLTRTRFLSDLHAKLFEQPSILAACGFNPYLDPPSLERFSAFMADTEHKLLEQTRNQLTKTLIANGVIEAKHVGLDSCPVESWVRENNPKTALAHSRFDKTKPPKADPEARLGVKIHYPSPGKKKVVFFWGYRNHVLANLTSELPIMEITAPNSVGEVSLAKTLLEDASSTFNINFESVSGDAEYDSEAILRYIIRTLKAKAVIPRSPTHTQDHSGFQREKQDVICPANLKMYRKGKMTANGITYLQFCCPFYYGTKPGLLFCPISHPKFSAQKGCNYLWRISDSIRDEIPYASDYFKMHYNRRTAIERVFSRLLAITLQEPSVHGLNSIKNHCTISHIAILLVAKAAHEFGFNNKIRFVRSFVPNFLS
ncbi:MAG TPA: transposase [archaeon]|nr:transposase [archaeon]